MHQLKAQQYQYYWCAGALVQPTGVPSLHDARDVDMDGSLDLDVDVGVGVGVDVDLNVD